MKLKLVKNAHLIRDQNLVQIQHYDTIIFEFDELTKSARVFSQLSRTSDRQIRHAVEFFQPDTIERIYPTQKWAYSKPLGRF